MNYEILNILGFSIAVIAVLTIDTCGFLGRNSEKWTLKTIRVHKITKPLIWLGILILAGNHLLHYNEISQSSYINWTLFILISNGSFLSFYVSPFLLKQEKGRSPGKILPQKLQKQITISFCISLSAWSILAYLLFF